MPEKSHQVFRLCFEIVELLVDLLPGRLRDGGRVASRLNLTVDLQKEGSCLEAHLKRLSQAY